MHKIIRIQTSADLKKHENVIADTLSKAFYNDPYYIHIMSNHLKRISQIKWFQMILLKYTLKNGHIYLSANGNAAAMWLGPDKPFINDMKLAVLGLILFPIKIGLGNFTRLIKISDEWKTEHLKQNKRHYYLMVIGVNPDLQRQGIGSKLLKDFLKKVDSENLDCFLETVTIENVMFYQKYNFQIVFNKNFGPNYQYWLMKRSPKNE